MSEYKTLEGFYSDAHYGAPVFLMALRSLMIYGTAVKDQPLNVFGEYILDETKQRVKELAVLMSGMDFKVVLAAVQRLLPPIEGDGKNIPLLNDGHKDGICPCCGAKIDYEGDQDIVDDSDMRVSWECPNCGATGHANYHGVFVGHSDIQPAEEATEA